MNINITGVNKRPQNTLGVNLGKYLLIKDVITLTSFLY